MTPAAHPRSATLRSPVRTILTAVLLVLAAAALHAASTQTQGKLRVFFIDVEGGQSTLFVTPSGQSLLIDTGWDGNHSRDALRILAAAKEAGLSRIDYVLITHFHEDHMGGVKQLLDRIPVGTFIDHGENREPQNADRKEEYDAYQKMLASGRSKHIVGKPGDVLTIGALKLTAISADGNLIPRALPGAGQANDLCARTTAAPADQTENSRSLGTLIEFGNLKLLDLGDLTKDKERQLVCPVNKLGHVDVYIVSHHGWYQSSSPEFVDALHARVAIMDNGATKGGSLPTLKTLRQAPGLESLWQLHFSEEGGPAFNTGEQFIANLNGPDAGNPIELIGDRSGSFDVVNWRTKLVKHYSASPKR